MSHENRPHDGQQDCGECAIAPDRRAFLRTAALAVGGALLALGASPADALARPLAFTRALAATGQARTYPIPAEDGAEIDRDNDVILVRWQGSIYAFNLSCPHQNTALRWLPKDGRFQCPKHKSKYRPDGSFIEGRATRGMDRFPVSRQGDAIAVDTGRLLKESDDAAAWTAAVVKLQGNA